MASRRTPAVAIALVGMLTLSITGGSAAVARAGPSYHSPGYRGMTRLGKVVVKPLPPVVLGTGKYPNLLVDPAGTAYVVFDVDGGSSSPDTISYCALPRGQRACRQTSGGLAPGTPDQPGNFPGGNHDFDGAVPLAIGNQPFIVQRRFPDQFTTPDGSTSDSNVFLWSSDNGGATFTGPGMIGNNQMGGGAVVFGGAADPSIGTISRTETGGTFFQGVGAGRYTQALAALGSGDQAYSGALATDGDRPVATFADLSGNIFVREWSGKGDVNDAGTWSLASFHGYSPQIVSGSAGVFVAYSDSNSSGGNVLLRRIVGGQPGGAAKLSGPVEDPVLSESPSGELGFAFRDSQGIEYESSIDGVFSASQLIASIPATSSIDHLSAAATADGGGFVTFVKDGQGAESVGTVIAAAFGTQRATGRPGLGALPGGGIGSSLGDQLATSTCTTARFGAVTAEILAGCFLHDVSNPQLDVSLGEVNINGLHLIPDAGVKIAINPHQHTIDTTGAVSVVLEGTGVNVTIWHGEIHAQIPLASPGFDLFDFHELAPPDIAGFPVSGDVDVKLTSNGAEVPVSLKLPNVFGGVTGQATLITSLNGGLNLGSLRFTVADANFGAFALHGVDISYTLANDVWKGTGTLQVPAGGGLMSLTLSIEFDHGAYRSGAFDVGLPYPGVPLDLNDTPPQLYLTHGGLGLGLSPFTLTGTVGMGITPLAAPGAGGLRDYTFSLEGTLTAAFGNPVTITVTAKGFLYQIKVEQGTLTWRLPDEVTLTGSSGYDLGVIKSTGTISAIFDPEHKLFGGQISSAITLDLATIGVPSFLGGGSEITIPTQAIAINNNGFGVYVPPGVAPFVGTITYHWGETLPSVHPFSSDLSEFTSGIPAAAGDRRAHAAAVTSVTVPPGAPSAALEVSGHGGPPAVVLTTPAGKQVTPSTSFGAGASVVALGDAAAGITHIGINHPAAGRWTVQQAPGSHVAVTGVRYATGEAAPVVKAALSHHGRSFTLRYRVKLPKNDSVAFVEQTPALLHVLGKAHGPTGTIRFTPASGRPGRRQLVAMIDDNGLPLFRKAVASFVAVRPPLPGRPRRLHVRAGRRAFVITFAPPRDAARTLVVLRATDGRVLDRLLPAGVGRLSLPVVGFNDGVIVAVRGIAVDGRRGPAASARARIKTLSGVPGKKGRPPHRPR